MNINRFLLSLGVIVAVASQAYAGKVVLKLALTPTGSFDATSEAFQGVAVQGQNGFTLSHAEFDLSTFKTGIDLRDRHMRDKYLEVQKYPVAKITNANGKDGKFTADLTLRGVTKKIEGTYTVRGEEVEGRFKVQIPDFQIEKPRYMGVGVKDEVEATITLPVRRAGSGR